MDSQLQRKIDRLPTHTPAQQQAKQQLEQLHQRIIPHGVYGGGAATQRYAKHAGMIDRYLDRMLGGMDASRKDGLVTEEVSDHKQEKSVANGMDSPSSNKKEVTIYVVYGDPNRVNGDRKFSNCISDFIAKSGLNIKMDDSKQKIEALKQKLDDEQPVVNKRIILFVKFIPTGRLQQQYDKERYEKTSKLSPNNNIVLVIRHGGNPGAFPEDLFPETEGINSGVMLQNDDDDKYSQILQLLCYGDHQTRQYSLFNEGTMNTTNVRIFKDMIKEVYPDLLINTTSQINSQNDNPDSINTTPQINGDEIVKRLDTLEKKIDSCKTILKGISNSNKE